MPGKRRQSVWAAAHSAGKRLDWNVFCGTAIGSACICFPAASRARSDCAGGWSGLAAPWKSRGLRFGLRRSWKLPGRIGSRPLPDAALAAEILRGQPFRENLVLLADAEKTAGQWSRGRENGTSPVSRFWQEDFLRLVSTDLNGLYLVGQKEAAWEHFSDWLYEESGLPVCFVNRIPETDGRKTVLVELRANARILKEHPEFGSLYVDLTSDVEKRRQIREKRADISYISARNYLDTALKARYNAI